MARIVLVDDDPLVLSAVRTLLEKAGHEVWTAEDPAAALERAAECLPELMIVDAVLPEDTEGFELVWAIRRADEARLREVPIIMSTGLHELTALRFYPERGDGTCSPQQGLPIQEWLDKPFEPAQLLAAVSRVLAAAKPPPGR